MDILVAHDHRTGMLYVREFGMDQGPRPPRIVTRVDQLRGYSPPTTFVYVNSDNAYPDPDVLEELLILESLGCAVDWVGIEDPREALRTAWLLRRFKQRERQRLIEEETRARIWSHSEVWRISE